MLNNVKTVPSLKTKTNELFYRWLSRPERTEQLKEVISIICTSNRIPKLNELKSYKNELDNRSACKAITEQMQHGLQPSALPLNSNNSNNSRSKSPPSLHSPPMSPVSRMPQSPKSPRHRQPAQAQAKHSERPQSPGLLKTSDEFKSNHAKIQTSTSTPQPIIIQKQQPPQLLHPVGKNEPKQLLTNVDIDQVDQVPKSNKIAEQKQIVTSPAQIKPNKQVKKANIPQFHFPNGRPDDKVFKNDQETLKLISLEFKLFKDGKLNKDDLAQVCKIIGIPKYWKALLFRACTTASKLPHVTFSSFEHTWQKLTQQCFDRVTLFMKLIAPNASYIIYEDWEPLLQDIVDSHPGLKFLHDHKEFHTRYIKTVIARIFYVVNRSWSGRITQMELKRSNFLSILENLESEDDINLIRDFFSYEHFYVIYCKFWELDKDHDLYISKEDLFRHNNYSINPKVIDRIFSGTVLKGRDWREGLMSYYDFVWFLISEEDKRNPTSIEYWFRVLDIDGDGILSMYELEYFYSEQMEQMRERQIEYMPFNDLLCQMLDLVKPKESGKIRLKDLKQCKMANIFLDTFINLEKYLDYEQKDPFANIRDLDGPEQSDWDKYAAYEYENLVSEDGIGDNQEGYNNYDEDFDEEPMIFGNQNGNGISN